MDENDKAELEPRLESVAAVYKVLTTREVKFEFKKDEVFHPVKDNKKAKKP